MSIQQVTGSSSSSSAAAAAAGSNKRKRDDEATVEAVVKRVKTNFETVLGDKLICMPVVLHALVQAYLPPAPTKEALQILAKDILKTGKTDASEVVEALRVQADDVTPYIEGTSFDFRALSITFIDEVREADRYKRAADVMNLFFQLLPGTTIEVGSTFKWEESRWVPYSENARPLVLRPGGMKTTMHDLFWDKVKEAAPQLECSLMVMQAGTADPTLPVETLRIGTKKRHLQSDERKIFPEFPLIGPLFYPQRLPRPRNPDNPGIPDGPDAPNFRGPQMDEVE